MPITLHTEEAEVVPDQTELAVGRDRDDFQRSVDKIVSTLKTATAKASWPKPDPTKLFHRFVVDADDKSAMKAVIRRAATLHKVEADFYKDAKTEAGHVAIKFHVSRKPLLEKGIPVVRDGKPVFVADDTLDDKGHPKPEAPAAA